jgi:hypothetical protein
VATPPPSEHTVADTGAETSQASSGAYPGTPRWVKTSAIVVAVLILLLIVAAVATGGQHGPMRHMPSGAPGGPGTLGHTQPAAQAIQRV